MKEEHYRRIAFTNVHFTEKVPGWKTDRGRIYISFGPPDEIDAHPSGDASRTDPYENWRYRHIEGIGNDVLIDFVGTEYRMTLDPNEKEALIRSEGPAPQMLVAVRPDRTLRISIPIDFAAKQSRGFARITTPAGLPVATLDFQGNGGKPGYQIESKSLNPGTYTVTTVVTDSPSGKVHTWSVPITIK
jgi:hypothetical protein